VGEDGLRVTPDADQDGLTVHFYGDSVTMCWGVNDDACWVNLVADELSINARNYGRNAYNAWNIEALMSETKQGRCSVFLTIGNDLEEPVVYEKMRKSNPDYPAIVRYFIDYTYLTNVARQSAPPEHPTFDPSMRAILGYPNVLLVALDDGKYGDIVQSRYGATLIPYFTSRVSFADGHASEVGNQQITEAITPVIEQWLSTRSCQ
jgi:hypothetical protein